MTAPTRPSVMPIEAEMARPGSILSPGGGRSNFAHSSVMAPQAAAAKSSSDGVVSPSSPPGPVFSGRPQAQPPPMSTRGGVQPVSSRSRAHYPIISRTMWAKSSVG